MPGEGVPGMDFPREESTYNEKESLEQGLSYCQEKAKTHMIKSIDLAGKAEKKYDEMTSIGDGLASIIDAGRALYHQKRFDHWSKEADYVQSILNKKYR